MSFFALLISKEVSIADKPFMMKMSKEKEIELLQSEEYSTQEA